MSPLNTREVLGRKVGLPGLAVGTIVGAGWSWRVPVERMTDDGHKYRTLVAGYIVRWPWGALSKPMPFDRLKRSDLLPVDLTEVSS